MVFLFLVYTDENVFLNIYFDKPLYNWFTGKKKSSILNFLVPLVSNKSPLPFNSHTTSGVLSSSL